MTLYEVVHSLQNLALTQPNVRSAWDGSIYDVMDTNPSIKYKAFVVTQNTHQETEDSDIYGLTLFMCDRLEDDLDSNRLRIQSTCKEQLSNIIRIFVDNLDIDFPTNIVYTPWTQKFVDECAGVYVQLSLEIFKSPCYDGAYPIVRPEIKLQAKTLNIIENGTLRIIPDADYDGLSSVVVKVNVPTKIESVDAYLYNLDYDDIDYTYAREYFETKAPINVGGCSAIRSGNYVGRKLDWTYDYGAVFALHTPNKDGRKAVWGVAGGLASATIQQMESGLTEEQKKIIPFYLQDGINEDGLCAEINVVPTLGNTETHPTEQTDRVCSLMLVRYILDHYSTVNEVIEGLSHVQIYFPQALLDMGYECHYLIADDERTAVLEIIDGQLKTIISNKSTNFHLYGVTANTDGSVNTNYTAISGHYASSNGIEGNGSGLERWNILNASTVNSKADMDALMDAINYSKTYTLPVDANFWYSEFVGGNIDTDTPADDVDFLARIDEYKAKWEDRDRSTGEVWISCHSVIYDLENKVMYLKVQESNSEHVFRLYEPSCEPCPEPEYESKEYIITSNGITDIVVDEGFDGITGGSIIVNVEQLEPVLESLSVTENGTYTAPSGVDGYSAVTVNVPSTPCPEPLLIDLEVTENGFYSVPTGYDGFSSVLVDVESQEWESHILTVNVTADTRISELVDEVVVTVTTDSQQTQLYGGSPMLFDLKPGMEVTVDYSDVNNFSTPPSYSFISMWDGHSTVTGEYLYTGSTTPTGDYLVFSTDGEQRLGAVKEGEYNLQYSYDCVNWTNWDATTEILFRNGANLYMRGKNDNMGDGTPLRSFMFKLFTSSPTTVSGKLTSLLDWEEEPSELPAYCFSHLFHSCHPLVSAEELVLPSTISPYMYYGFLSNCDNLTIAPELPATTLELACYDSMFANCTSLVNAPVLTAITLAEGCYFAMFSGCTSLATAPELPATVLRQRCYTSMFEGCTNLVNAPELPATVLGRHSYEYMFRNCSSLNDITMLATDISANRCLADWVYGVANNGTFTCASGMEDVIPSGESGIPNNWTIIEQE